MVYSLFDEAVGSDVGYAVEDRSPNIQQKASPRSPWSAGVPADDDTR